MLSIPQSKQLPVFEASHLPLRLARRSQLRTGFVINTLALASSHLTSVLPVGEENDYGFSENMEFYFFIFYFFENMEF